MSLWLCAFQAESNSWILDFTGRIIKYVHSQCYEPIKDFLSQTQDVDPKQRFCFNEFFINHMKVKQSPFFPFWIRFNLFQILNCLY